MRNRRRKERIKTIREAEGSHPFAERKFEGRKEGKSKREETGLSDTDKDLFKKMNR